MVTRHLQSLGHLHQPLFSVNERFALIIAGTARIIILEDDKNYSIYYFSMLCLLPSTAWVVPHAIALSHFTPFQVAIVTIPRINERFASQSIAGTTPPIVFLKDTTTKSRPPY